MKDLKIKVSGQNLTKEVPADWSGLIRGTKGYVRFVFSFDGEWAECTQRAAKFEDGGIVSCMPIIKGTCELPPEFTNSRKVKMSLVGTNGEDFKIKTGKIEVVQK